MRFPARRPAPTLRERIRRDEGGAVAVEFGLLGLFMIVLLLGVVQFGMSMQRYNALRSVAADTARHTTVAYQTGNRLTKAQIELYASSIAVSSPYFVDPEGLQVTAPPGTPPYVGTLRFDLTIRAKVDSFTQMIGIEDYYISYSRPIYVSAT